MTPTVYRRLPPLLQQALAHIPSGAEQAAQVSVLTELGYRDMEIAKRLGLTWKGLERVRDTLQAGVIEALRSDGYSDPEIARYLQIPQAQVEGKWLLHEPTCLRRISSEVEAGCTCQSP